MPKFHATALRIKDPKRAIPHYQTNYGMTLLHMYHFPKVKQSHYYLATLPAGMDAPSSECTPDSEQFLNKFAGTALQLVHSWGTEADDNFVANHGNKEPLRGFGHIAFNTPDVYSACAALEAAGVKFQKKPDEGRMKGLAFALDEDGYWVEIVQGVAHPGRVYNLSQTMLRVKDINASLAFYRDKLGMQLVTEKRFDEAKFSLYFLASPTHHPDVDPAAKAAAAAGGGDGTVSADGLGDLAITKRMFWPCLELTYNHGTEEKEGAVYHNGSDVLTAPPAGCEDAAAAAAACDPSKAKGFAGLTFVVESATAVGDGEIDIDGLKVKGMRDPDGYPVRFMTVEESQMALHEDL